jgi:hypothetical protein
MQVRVGSSPIFGDKSPIDSPRRDWPGQKKSERKFVEASQGMHSWKHMFWQT